jgi:hypothetical protein
MSEYVFLHRRINSFFFVFFLYRNIAFSMSLKTMSAHVTIPLSLPENFSLMARNFMASTALN